MSRSVTNSRILDTYSRSWRVIIAAAILAAVVQLASTTLSSAAGLQFQFFRVDNRPVSDLTERIFVHGEITAGDTDRFLAFIAEKKPIADAMVILDSVGGSALEGIRLGEAIRAASFRTDVGVAENDGAEIGKGGCYSACVYSYLGGIYRYLTPGSRIGVHRFRFEAEVKSDTAAEISQLLSGLIVSYIEKSRASPSLFKLMTEAAPQEIAVLSEEQLRDLFVVTGDIYSERWVFEINGSATYLKAEQITWRGTNKLIFSCATSKGRVEPYLLVITESPSATEVVAEHKASMLFIDNTYYVVPKNLTIGRPEIVNNDYINWTVRLTKQLSAALIEADRIGAALTPGDPRIFAGFKGIRNDKSERKLERLIERCPPQR